nr:probable sphingolipid transporter spinster homolog 2 [Tanacetum cinerariifolium]
MCSINPFRLIGVGLSVWTFAVAGCGISIDFWSITTCRMLVGVGEASFISLAAPFIDDTAPVTQRTAWLGIFYMLEMPLVGAMHSLVRQF